MYQENWWSVTFYASGATIKATQQIELSTASNNHLDEK